MFYFVLVLLGLLASAFVFLPLLRRETTVDTDRNELNRSFYQQRLSEIDDDPALDEAQKEQLKIEAGRDLLADVKEPVVTGSDTVQVNTRRVLVVSSLLVPFIAFLFYLDVGVGRGNITDHELAQDLQSLDPSDQQAYLAIVDRMADRAAGQPENTDMQFLLGQMLTSVSRFEEAADVYGSLAVQFPAAPEVASRYAESLFLADDRRMTNRVEAAVETALGLNPHDVTMFEVKAMGAVTGGDLEQALAWLRKAKEMDVNGERSQLIDNAIRQLEQQTGIEPQPVDGGRTIILTLEVDPLVDLPPESTVFVFARAAEGPPAPLAVQRLQLKDLPTRVVLDESMAMMPGLSLAEFDQVLVVARATRSGNVVPSAGDVEARSDVISLESERTEMSLIIKDAITPAE